MKAGLALIVGISIAGLACASVEPAAAAGHKTHHRLRHASFHHVAKERFASHRHHHRHYAAPVGVGSIRELIAKHAAENGVPFQLADAVVQIESRYQPHVANGGALGLMQIKPATARGVGFGGSAQELYTADTNLRYGMRYLAQVYQKSGGDLCGTVMRYQSGAYSTHMNAANRAYCSKARSIMARN